MLTRTKTKISTMTVFHHNDPETQMLTSGGFGDNGILGRWGVIGGADETGIWEDNDTLSKTPQKSFVLFLAENCPLKTLQVSTGYVK